MGGVGDRVAHGGPIVAILGGIDNILWFFIAVIIGSIITMLTVLFFKKNTPANEVDDSNVNSESINDMKNNNKTQNVGTTPLTEESLQNKMITRK